MVGAGELSAMEVLPFQDGALQAGKVSGDRGSVSYPAGTGECQGIFRGEHEACCPLCAAVLSLFGAFGSAGVSSLQADILGH